MPQSSLMGWLKQPTSKTYANAVHQDEGRLPPSPAAATVADANEPILPVEHDNPTPAQQVRGLPPNVELRECRQEDIKAFKRLNALLLPVPYGDNFYREIMKDLVTHNLTMMALWHDNSKDTTTEKGTLVGAIRCRLLPDLPGSTPVPSRKEGPMLYLSTLVLLSPYRGHGIAAKMLDVMVRRAVNDYGATRVGAHVWEANEEGRAWYRKRGFNEIGREEGYYRKLEPQEAVVVVKDVGVMDLLPVE